MPQIEIPFTPGQRVRRPSGVEFVVASVKFEGGEWYVSPADEQGWWRADSLALVEPVIEWERVPDGWSGRGGWFAGDNGRLKWLTHDVCVCADPRAIAEATQKMWNEARKNG